MTVEADIKNAWNSLDWESAGDLLLGSDQDVDSASETLSPQTSEVGPVVESQQSFTDQVIDLAPSLSDIAIGLTPSVLVPTMWSYVPEVVSDAVTKSLEPVLSSRPVQAFKNSAQAFLSADEGQGINAIGGALAEQYQEFAPHIHDATDFVQTSYDNFSNLEFNLSDAFTPLYKSAYNYILGSDECLQDNTLQENNYILADVYESKVKRIQQAATSVKELFVPLVPISFNQDSDLFFSFNQSVSQVRDNSAQRWNSIRSKISNINVSSSNSLDKQPAISLVDSVTETIASFVESTSSTSDLPVENLIVESSMAQADVISDSAEEISVVENAVVSNVVTDTVVSEVDPEINTLTSSFDSLGLDLWYQQSFDLYLTGQSSQEKAFSSLKDAVDQQPKSSTRKSFVSNESDTSLEFHNIDSAKSSDVEWQETQTVSVSDKSQHKVSSFRPQGLSQDRLFVPLEFNIAAFYTGTQSQSKQAPLYNDRIVILSGVATMVFRQEKTGVQEMLDDDLIDNAFHASLHTVSNNSHTGSDTQDHSSSNDAVVELELESHVETSTASLEDHLDSDWDQEWDLPAADVYA